MYVMGIPVSVTVDEFLPFNMRSFGGELRYGKPGVDGALWMPILEKAAAKLYGNYEMISGGYMGPAIQAMTGAPYFDTSHTDVTPDELWDYIDEKLAANWMVTAATFQGTGSDKDQNSLGVPYSHALTILGSVKLSDGTKLLKLRNPWAKETYFGPWSDKSDEWTAKYKEEAGYVDEDDGIWFISAEDYYDSFKFTSVNPDV